MPVTHYSATRTTGHLLESPREKDWRTQGACRDEDPDLFYPTGNGGRALWQTEQAKRVCRHCPVLERCREGVLERKEPFGVWGGMSEQERNGIRRSHQYSAARLALKQGKELACQRGAELIRHAAAAQDPARLANLMQSTEVAVRHALRILDPDQPPPVDHMAMERLLTHEDVLRRPGHTIRSLARELKTSRAAVAEALMVLDQRDQATGQNVRVAA